MNSLPAVCLIPIFMVCAMCCVNFRELQVTIYDVALLIRRSPTKGHIFVWQIYSG